MNKYQRIKSHSADFLRQLPQDRFAVYLGFLLIFLIAIFAVYFGTVRYNEISKFYPVYFKVNFLAGIEPGMKVRYQGGVEIGEVVEIISQYSSHTLYAKIDNNFFIPRDGTKVSIKSFGYFGKLYIDVTSVAEPFETDLYKPNDTIIIEPIQSFEETLQMFSRLIQKSEDGSLAPLSAKLLSIRNMIRKLRRSPLSTPRIVRQNIVKFSDGVQSNLKSLSKYSLITYETVNDMYISLSDLADNLRRNIPIIKNRIQSFKEFTEYHDINGSSSMLHDELLYWTILNNIDTFHQKLILYKEEPYRIFF